MPPKRRVVRIMPAHEIIDYWLYPAKRCSNALDAIRYMHRHYDSSADSVMAEIFAEKLKSELPHTKNKGDAGEDATTAITSSSPSCAASPYSPADIINFCNVLTSLDATYFALAADVLLCCVDKFQWHRQTKLLLLPCFDSALRLHPSAKTRQRITARLLATFPVMSLDDTQATLDYVGLKSEEKGFGKCMRALLSFAKERAASHRSPSFRVGLYVAIAKHDAVFHEKELAEKIIAVASSVLLVEGAAASARKDFNASDLKAICKAIAQAMRGDRHVAAAVVTHFVQRLDDLLRFTTSSSAARKERCATTPTPGENGALPKPLPIAALNAAALQQHSSSIFADAKSNSKICYVDVKNLTRATLLLLHDLHSFSNMPDALRLSVEVLRKVALRSWHFDTHPKAVLSWVVETATLHECLPAVVLWKPVVKACEGLLADAFRRNSLDDGNSRSRAVDGGLGVIPRLSKQRSSEGLLYHYILYGSMKCQQLQHHQQREEEEEGKTTDECPSPCSPGATWRSQQRRQLPTEVVGRIMEFLFEAPLIAYGELGLIGRSFAKLKLRS